MQRSKRQRKVLTPYAIFQAPIFPKQIYIKDSIQRLKTYTHCFTYENKALLLDTQSLNTNNCNRKDLIYNDVWPNHLATLHTHFVTCTANSSSFIGSLHLLLQSTCCGGTGDVSATLIPLWFLKTRYRRRNTDSTVLAVYTQT